MDSIRSNYIPMTETAFYILFSLKTPRHGYGISQHVKNITNGEVIIGPGTMYGTLSKMERDGLICIYTEVEKRKIYQITEIGEAVLNLEIKRIERLYKTAKEINL